MLIIDKLNDRNIFYQKLIFLLEIYSFKNIIIKNQKIKEEPPWLIDIKYSKNQKYFFKDQLKMQIINFWDYWNLKIKFRVKIGYFYIKTPKREVIVVIERYNS